MHSKKEGNCHTNLNFTFLIIYSIVPLYRKKFSDDHIVLVFFFVVVVVVVFVFFYNLGGTKSTEPRESTDSHNPIIDQHTEKLLK